MILVRDLITDLGLDLKCSEQFIEGGGRPYKVFTAPMVDMCIYESKTISLIGHVQPE